MTVATPFRVPVLALVAVVLAALVLAGCAESTPTLSKGEIEEQIETALAKEVDTPIEATCDGGMDAVKGEEKYCTGVAEGTDDLEQRVRVRVGSVSDDKAKVDVMILQQFDPATGAESIQQQLVDAGSPDAVVTCPDGLADLEEGNVVECDIAGDADVTSATLTVGADNDIDSVETDLE